MYEFVLLMLLDSNIVKAIGSRATTNLTPPLGAGGTTRLASLIIRIIFLFQLFVRTSYPLQAHNILCYVCENQIANTLCNSETVIQDCEDGFDTCQTITHFSEVSEMMTITKSCTRNTSCWDQKAVAEKLHPCDSSGNTWTCVECCWYDKCNRNEAFTPTLQDDAYERATTLALQMLLSIAILASLR